MYSLEKTENLVIYCDFSLSSAREAVEKYLNETKILPTAIMAGNDMVAIGAMEAIKSRNLSIPEEISVLGFDDIDLSNEVVPRLSTMHVSKKIMGKVAVNHLLNNEFNVHEGSMKILLKPELLERNSTTVCKRSV